MPLKVTGKQLSRTNQANTPSKLKFAMKDADNLIHLYINLNRLYLLCQTCGGQPTKDVTPSTKSSALPAEPTVCNELQIAVKGSRLNSTVNGALLKSIPIHGLNAGMIGLAYQSPTRTPGQFKTLQLT